MPTPPRSVLEVFLGFLSIGARSFGGVLPWAHRVIVEERKWLARADFLDVLALCQFLPGPNIANMAVVLGRRWFGLPGALAGFLGLMALPFVWVLALAALYADWAAQADVRAVITGIGVAGGGLFLGTALKLGQPLARKPMALALIAGCFAAVGLLRVSLLVVLPVAVVLALASARQRWL
ncbi:MAG: chromate transporter [Betaproteobacteria bacterium]|nr:MAG: chromate transporter [Betaproteobacteria bacterium]